MANVTIEELGLSFVRICMEQYWGNCLYPILFAAGLLVWCVFFPKEKASRIFLYQTVFLFLTVYNPFLVKILVPAVQFENEYYRFFWALPVIPGLSYFAVKVVFTVKNRLGRAGAAVMIALVLVFTGVPLNGVVKNFAMTQNLYKVPNDLRAVCDVIHSDTDKENPRVVFDIQLNSFARQYDASLHLVLNRNAVLYRAGSTVAGTMNEESVGYRRQKYIMDVLYYSERIKRNRFVRALKGTKTDYLVVPVAFGLHDYVKKAGCRAIAQTENYVVYRFEGA